MKFNNYLFRERLKSKHIDKKQLGQDSAKEIGISRKTFYRLIDDTNKFAPVVVTFAKCCRWMGCKMEEFLI